ncbi:MAG: indole-3-glycerol phosphate synthase TrpC [Phycisphaerae bacterium]|nr:indole-3-glycerol phosphate synthase TrpC [Phycisphaerae bacterium]
MVFSREGTPTSGSRLPRASHAPPRQTVSSSPPQNKTTSTCSSRAARSWCAGSLPPPTPRATLARFVVQEIIVGTILDGIIDTKRREVAEAQAHRPLDRVIAEARAAEPPRDFQAAIRRPAPRGVHLIAEIKKASPSAGLIRADFDAVAIARIYHESGASALSVLTDRTYFQGELAYIAQVKQAVPLPVLRKDFTVEAYQVYEARAAGADAILLISEVLATDEIVDLLRLADSLEMTTLIEAHTPSLLLAVHAAIRASGGVRYLLGINNRDLARQVVDVGTTERAARLLSDTSILVAESGIHTPADVARVRNAGAAAMLVGESLMAAPDIAGKMRELLGASPTRP